MGPPSEEIILRISEAVSEALEIPIYELPPLSDVIDPDGLDAIVSTTEDASSRAVTVRFEYAGLELFIHSDDIIYVQPIDQVPENSGTVPIG